MLGEKVSVGGKNDETKLLNDYGTLMLVCF